MCTVLKGNCKSNMLPRITSAIKQGCASFVFRVSPFADIRVLWTFAFCVTLFWNYFHISRFAFCAKCESLINPKRSTYNKEERKNKTKWRKNKTKINWKPPKFSKFSAAVLKRKKSCHNFISRYSSRSSKCYESTITLPKYPLSPPKSQNENPTKLHFYSMGMFWKRGTDFRISKNIGYKIKDGTRLMTDIPSTPLIYISNAHRNSRVSWGCD